MTLSASQTLYRASTRSGVIGPCSLMELQLASRSGHVTKGTMVENVTQGGVVPAHDLPGLFSPRSKMVAVLLAVFVGWLGVDRMYLGHTGLGILKLLLTLFTLGIVGGIWWLIDIFVIGLGRPRDGHGMPVI